MPLDERLCPGRCFFDHDSSYIQNSLPPEALQSSFSILPVDPHPLRYTDENLQLAASYLKRYLETSDTHDWLHVVVKAIAFPSFLRATSEDCGKTGLLLPFSCWCDGAPYDEPRHRQHRHMIVVTDSVDRYKREVWEKVGTEDRPCKNYPSKDLRRIESPMHLVNTLGYLSQRHSSCEFSFRKKKNKIKSPKHFYIFTTLPVHYQLALAVLWEGGLAKLMYQELFQNVSVERVAEYPLSIAHKQWRQKINNFYALPRGLVLPVDRNLVPAAECKTPLHFHLLKGRKLYFEALPERLDPEPWLARQAEGGNLFYETVTDEWWVPRRNDQEKLNLIMPRELKIQELLLEKEHLKQKHETRINELIQEKKQLTDENKELYQGQIKRLKTEKEQLKKEREKCTCNNNINVNTNIS